uniref:50S ribosomal protein L11 n=1 Tax=Nitzschia alba TaxID=2858 RepID=A0A5C0F2P4_NITAL|nr:50S ribosomal protein L11 [Nitzschia alba]QEI59582.1 50S ribosomal protein L11 [Nitzschia alba]
MGPSLGQHGININSFCEEYNSLTMDKIGSIIPVKISLYEDKSYTFILKTPPTSALLIKALKIKKGSSLPNNKKVGTIAKDQLTEIAKIKLPDLNTNNLNKAIKIIEGTAKNMGISKL